MRVMPPWCAVVFLGADHAGAFEVAWNRRPPSDPVTRGQMAVFITKEFGLTLYGA